MATVSGAPIRSARAPPSNAPNGAMPMNIIEYTAMTRPRRWSGTMAWISVLEDDICSIMQKPTGSSSAVESQNTREKENRTRLNAEAAAGERYPAAQSFHPAARRQSERAQLTLPRRLRPSEFPVRARRYAGLCRQRWA